MLQLLVQSASHTSASLLLSPLMVCTHTDMCEHTHTHNIKCTFVAWWYISHDHNKIPQIINLKRRNFQLNAVSEISVHDWFALLLLCLCRGSTSWWATQQRRLLTSWLDRKVTEKRQEEAESSFPHQQISYTTHLSFCHLLMAPR